MSAHLSVVIPVYNEQATLAHVVERVLAHTSGTVEVIIVDDCSTDLSLTIARQLAAGDDRVILLQHSRNLGKTGALKTGFAHSTGDVVIVQDADLEYDPVDIPAVMAPIVSGRADVVFGSRFAYQAGAGCPHFRQVLANRALTMATNAVMRLRLTDVETGYKAFRGDIIRSVDITSARFGFEIEITSKIVKLGHRIVEVPVSYKGRSYAEGKKIGARDFVEAVWLLAYFHSGLNSFSLRKNFLARADVDNSVLSAKVFIDRERVPAVANVRPMLDRPREPSSIPAVMNGGLRAV